MKEPSAEGNLEKQIEAIINLPLDIKEKVAKCLVKGTYVNPFEGNALCIYFHRDKCPYAEKPRKDVEKYVCTYWQGKLTW